MARKRKKEIQSRDEYKVCKMSSLLSSKDNLSGSVFVHSNVCHKQQVILIS